MSKNSRSSNRLAHFLTLIALTASAAVVGNEFRHPTKPATVTAATGNASSLSITPVSYPSENPVSTRLTVNGGTPHQSDATRRLFQLAAEAAMSEPTPAEDRILEPVDPGAASESKEDNEPNEKKEANGPSELNKPKDEPDSTHHNSSSPDPTGTSDQQPSVTPENVETATPNSRSTIGETPVELDDHQIKDFASSSETVPAESTIQSSTPKSLATSEPPAREESVPQSESTDRESQDAVTDQTSSDSELRVVNRITGSALTLHIGDQSIRLAAGESMVRKGSQDWDLRVEFDGSPSGPLHHLQSGDYAIVRNGRYYNIVATQSAQ